MERKVRHRAIGMGLSAGIVLYRITGSGPEVLLGHMGGPFWSRKDKGAWTIPKGLVEKGEDPVKTAVREFGEEVGPLPNGEFIPLGEVVQKGGKKVVAWAVEGDFDVTHFQSNLFTMEWPPKSGRSQQFPELDRVQWFPIGEAALKVIEAQAEFFHRLIRWIEEEGRSG